MTGVEICEVGPRDGLQNDRVVLEPAVRAELVERLAATGLRNVEAVSFVNPKLVPAMAGAEQVMAAVRRPVGTRISGLVLNEKGYERALAAAVDEVHYAFACTDEFGLRNQNQTIEQGLEVGQTLVRRARADGKPITITLIVAFGCPFAGPVPAARVLGIVERLMGEPPNLLSLADTIGVAVPTQVSALVAAVAAGGAATGAHLHNTRNTGYANAVAALEAGARVLDASVGGIGGCPFAPRATGNIATEDLIYLLEGIGVSTGVDLDRLIGVSEWLSGQLAKELPGMLYKAGGFPASSGR